MRRRVPHRRLSEPFGALTLDIQARVDAALALDTASSAEDCRTDHHNIAVNDGVPVQRDGSASAARQQHRPLADDSLASGPEWEQDEVVEVPVTADGLCNAVLVWFEADLGDEQMLSSWNACSSCSSEGSGGGGSDGRQAGSGQACRDRADVASSGTAFAASWSQGLQYLDGVRARKARARVAVRRNSRCPMPRTIGAGCVSASHARPCS